MKVNIDVTVQVSDEQRVQIANVLDEKISKRQATRVEVKEFIWEQGSSWETDLMNEFNELENDTATDDLSLDDIL